MASIQINRKKVNLIIEELRKNNYLLADILARTPVDKDWYKIKQAFESVDSAIQEFEKEENGR